MELNGIPTLTMIQIKFKQSGIQETIDLILVPINEESKKPLV